MFAADASGKQRKLLSEPVTIECLRGSGVPAGVRLRSGETQSAIETRISTLKPGKYRLVVRFFGDGGPTMTSGERTGWLWNGYAASKPVDLFVP